jgi:ABC-type polysaccharide/polyol phosphate transport system ATPase subunit
MAEYAVEFNSVSKSFRRGERPTLLHGVLPLIFSKLRSNPSLQYKNFWALKNVSFKVKKGETLGLVGHNGAGKSTILKLLAGIMAPNSGNIITHGRVSCLIIAGAGFHPLFTGRENIYLNGSIMGMNKKEIRRKFNSIVEFAGYGFPDYKKFIDTPVKRYSSGMFVRLGFAIAVHVEPQILLVDEVLAVGDFIFQQKCFEYINSLKKSNTTIIMVSHNMPYIVNYCDRVIMLKEGQVVCDGSPGKVVSTYENDLAKEASWISTGNVPMANPHGGTLIGNVLFANAEVSEGSLCFDYARPIDISFDYNCLQYSLADITFAFSAYRKIDGYKCFTVLSHMYGCRPQVSAGQVKLAIKDHNLLPGDYVFDIEIRNLKNDMPLAVHRESFVKIRQLQEQYLDWSLYGVYQPAHILWSI